MDPEEIRRLTHSEAVDRCSEIQGMMKQLNDKHRLSRAEQGRFDDLREDFAQVNEHRQRLERKQDLREMALGNGVHVVPGASRGDEYHADDDRPQRGRRDGALRMLDDLVSQNRLPARSAQTVEQLTRTGSGQEQGWTQRVVEATGDDAYLRAFSKLVADPARGHLLWDKQEHAAFQRVEQLRSETRAMSTTDNQGGYMSPLVIDPSILISSAGSINPLRQISRVVQTVSDTWNGITSAGVTFEWLAEAAQAADASPTLASPSIPVYKAGGFVPWSYEIGMDAINFTQELGRLLSDGYDQHTAVAFTTGTGTGQPTGIITTLVGTGSVVPTVGSEVIASGDVYAVQNALPPRFQANAQWCANLSILNTLRQFETAAGALKFPGLQNVPPVLLGRNANELSNMDGVINAGQENYTLLYGDFSNFVIVDRFPTQLELIPNLMGANGRPTGQRGAWLWARVGSDSVIDGAFRLLNAT